VTDSAPKLGRTISDYRTLEKLGGEMGVVYKAEDTRLESATSQERPGLTLRP
jgi:hypothetical protein